MPRSSVSISTGIWVTGILSYNQLMLFYVYTNSDTVMFTALTTEQLFCIRGY